MSDTKNSGEDGIVIKKYANRRLYNTASSSYVTLEDLSTMVKAGQDFTVHDAKTGNDITRSVLTQIIFEEEGKGQNLLPINFLRQLIRFYGDSMQAVVPTFLEHTMQAFAKGQENMGEQMTNAFGGVDMLKIGEEMARQNLALFQQTMAMFGSGATNEKPKPAKKSCAREPEKKAAKKPEDADKEDDLAALKQQLSAMQAQLDELAKKDV